MNKKIHDFVTLMNHQFFSVHFNIGGCKNPAIPGGAYETSHMPRQEWRDKTSLTILYRNVQWQLEPAILH